MASIAPSAKLVTISEFEVFLAQPDHQRRLFQLVNGEIIEKMPTQQHGLIASRLNARLFIHIEKTGQGYVAVEVLHRLPNDPNNARQPDVAYYSEIREGIVEEGATPYMPDLAIEIQSPRDSVKHMRERADYYLSNGSSMVWLIYPEKRVMEVYTLDEVELLNEDDILEGGDLIPDFKLPVKDIFALRS